MAKCLNCIVMRLSVQYVLLVLSLCCVHLLQWLLKLLLPSASQLLTKVISYLEGRKREELLRQEEAAHRARSDKVAARFVEERVWQYTQLQRHGDVGSRHRKFWYRVSLEEGEQKLLTVAPLPTSCPLTLDKDGVISLNTLFHTIQHPLLHKVEEVRYYQEGNLLVMVQPLVNRGSLKDLIHKTSPDFSWSAKYSKYGRSAVMATSGMLKTLNKLHRKSHPLLHNIQTVQYFPDSEQMQVIIVQSESERSSLTDLLHLTSPTKGRENGSVKAPLTRHMIASYGRQILEAILYLYELDLCPLGHIQTGNIFTHGSTCRLGGYENTLLGYKPRLYQLFKPFSKCEEIDVIMFGHVIFEMACGYELTSLVPKECDYLSVTDHSVVDVLQNIFERNQQGTFTSSIKKILAEPLFRDAHLPPLEGRAWLNHASLSSDLRTLISQAVRGTAVKSARPTLRCSVQ